MPTPEEQAAARGAVPATPKKERLALAAVWYLIVAWCVGGAFGRFAPETKLELTWDPVRYLGRALGAWDPSGAFGRLQNQAIGYLVPTGALSTLLKAIGMPGWLIPRLILALTFGAALLGAHRLARAVGVASGAGRVLSATAYTLAPAILPIASIQSGTHLPYALAPWVLVPLLDHERLGPRRAGLRSALAVALMGGVNAASTAAVLPPAVLWFLLRTGGPARRRLAGWWVLGLFAATAWWLLPFLVSVRYGFNFTPFTEQSWLTASTQSTSDVWRGTGNWLAYIKPGGRVLYPGAQALVQDSVAIVGSMVLVIAGALGLSRRDAPGRRWLLPSAVLGAIAIGSTYYGYGAQGPLVGPLRSLLDGPLVAFRNMQKFAPMIQLPLAIGIGHLVTVVGARRSEVGRRQAPMARFAAGAGAVAILASIAPLIPGRLFVPGSFVDVPVAWRQAAAWADAQPGASRTLILPGATAADYLWGRPQDEPFALLAKGDWATRDIIPLGGNGSTRMLDGIDDALSRGTLPDGFVETLRRAGIGRIIVRNDLHSDRDGAPAPTTLHRLLAGADGLRAGPSFGPALDPAAVLTDARLGPRPGDNTPIRQLETWVVEDPVDRVTSYPLDGSIEAGGAPEVSVDLPSDLVEGRAVWFDDDRPATAANPLTIATDSARRRDVKFGSIRRNSSWTLEADESSPITGKAPVDRWSDADPPPLTVARLDGADSITEQVNRFSEIDSASGPWAAFDGDDETVWAAQRVGDRLTVAFLKPTPLRSLKVTLPSTVGRRVTAIRVVTDTGSVERTIGGRRHTTIDLDGQPTDSVTVEVAATSPAADGPSRDTVGIAEIALDGISIARPLIAAAPASGPADGAVLRREAADPTDASLHPEDTLLDRVVNFRSGSLSLSGTASARPSAALDAVLASALPTTGSGVTVDGSSWRDLPMYRPAAALDGDPGTAWVAAPDGSALDLTWDEPVRVETITVELADAPAAAGLAGSEFWVTVNGERLLRRPAADGSFRIPATTVDHLRIEAATSTAGGRRPVAVTSLHIDGAPDRIDAPDLQRAIDLPCGEGPSLVVGEKTVATTLSTTVADLLSGAPARWTACAPVAVGADETRLTDTGDAAFRIDSLTALPSASAADTTAPAAPRSTEPTEWASQDRAIDVGPGAAAIVAGTENENPGWQAKVPGGASAVRIDGWRQAWLIPASATPVTLDLRYRASTLFRAGLVLGLLLLIGLAIGARLPERRSDRPKASSGIDERRVSPWLAPGLAGAVGLLLGWTTVLALLPLLAIARWRPRWLRPLLGITLAAMGCWLVAPIGPAWATVNAGFERGPQTLAVIAWMALALCWAEPVTPAGSTPSSRDRGGRRWPRRWSTPGESD